MSDEETDTYTQTGFCHLGGCCIVIVFLLVIMMQQYVVWIRMKVQVCVQTLLIQPIPGTNLKAVRCVFIWDQDCVNCMCDMAF